MNIENPRVSVIVAARDEENYIERTLQSVRDQGHPVELIVVSNGSTDRTAEIARSYADSVIELEEGSIPKAKNAGYVAATGDIVAFLDADSPMRPGLLKETLELVSEGYVGGKGRIKPDTENVAGKLIFAYANFANWASIKWGNKHPGSTQSGAGAYIFCTRDAADGIREQHNALFDENLGTMEDVNFTERMAEQGQLGFTENEVSTSMRRYVKGKGHYLGVFLRDDVWDFFKPKGKNRQGYR